MAEPAAVPAPWDSTIVPGTWPFIGNLKLAAHSYAGVMPPQEMHNSRVSAEGEGELGQVVDKFRQQQQQQQRPTRRTTLTDSPLSDKGSSSFNSLRRTSTELSSTAARPDSAISEDSASKSRPIYDSRRLSVFHLTESSPQSQSPARPATPPSAPMPRSQQTPKNRTPKTPEWSAAKIEASLVAFSRDVQRDHARLLHFTLDTISQERSQQRRHLSPFDNFADLKAPVAEKGLMTDVMKVKLKQHGREHQRGKQDQRQATYKVTCLTTDKPRVPRYRFHHVEISKNILSPNTPLKFIPHLKDLQDGSGDTEKFNQWIEELESMDQKSGFDTTRRSDKATKTRTAECARILSLYLERWISRLGIEGCNKATLIRYMASQSENDDAITPQQKSSLLNTYSEGGGSPKAVKLARSFTIAFNRVFQKRRASLEDVLMLDESVENVVDNKKLSKDGLTAQKGGEDLMELAQQYVGTYSALGCLICFSHSCEHGDFDSENTRRCFSLEMGGKLSRLIKRRLVQQTKQNQSGTAQKSPPPCKNQCFRSYDTGNENNTTDPWSEGEVNLLRTMFVVLGDTGLKAQCVLANLLGRRCWDVYRQMKKMKFTLPAVDLPPEPANVKPLGWYNRHQKTLNNDWQDHTYTHEHALREQRDPCFHDGPCTAARGCPCVEAKVLCEQFCQCTADTCAYKFTGCACHASGKTCYARQKEGKPCICVQLNRECDPVLCKGCGARDRADPLNARNDHLHSTGCQNVALQRGLSKTVLLGKSQLDGCGYGLFTAEDIAADEFVIEYIGELITHDEGVRREARRGDVFDQESNSSYLFTLLEQDGIWVDAAMYGNLSRYINHASEHDKRGCNITPKILYVNGEFRIKFSSIRDIKAGEELFFNYGENFPNLTKKLLEDKGEAPDGDSSALPAGEKQKKRRGGRPANAKGVARKLTKEKSNVGRKTAGARKEAPSASEKLPDVIEEEAEDQDADNDLFVDLEVVDVPVKPRRGRKRKRFGGDMDNEDDEAGDEYRPGAKESEDSDFVIRREVRPTRRQQKRASAAAAISSGPSTTARFVVVDESDDVTKIDDGSKPVAPEPTTPSKNHGGRRKKTVTPADTIDSDDTPLMKSAPLRRATRRSGGELDADGDSAMDPAQFYGHSNATPDMEGSAEWNEDEDEDVTGSGSRQRTRKMPARYQS